MNPDGCTAVVTPLKKKDRFPAEYRVYKEEGRWYYKSIELYSEPIPIATGLPSDYLPVSHDKYEIIFKNGRAPRPPKKKRYRK